MYTPASAWNTNPGNIGTPAIGEFNGGSAQYVPFMKACFSLLTP